MTFGGSTTFQAQQASLSTGAAQGSYAQYTIPSSSTYLAQNTTTGGTPAPPGWLMANGALVSAPYGNRFAAVGTPTGFAVLDLQTHLEVIEGATPSAVRGIATDPGNGIIYMTAPESNSLITVPFPPAQ